MLGWPGSQEEVGQRDRCSPARLPRGNGKAGHQEAAPRHLTGSCVSLPVRQTQPYPFLILETGGRGMDKERWWGKACRFLEQTEPKIPCPAVLASAIHFHPLHCLRLNLASAVYTWDKSQPQPRQGTELWQPASVALFLPGAHCCPWWAAPGKAQECCFLPLLPPPLNPSRDPYPKGNMDGASSHGEHRWPWPDWKPSLGIQIQYTAPRCLPQALLSDP